MPDMREINNNVITEFRDNNGILSGPMAGAPILLLTTTGRLTGKKFTTPIGFVDAGGRLAVAAANGGADTNPDWYHNLVADADVTIEVPGATIAACATDTEGVERARLLELLSASLPGMSDHIAATTRPIPVVLITEQKEASGAVPPGAGGR